MSDRIIRAAAEASGATLHEVNAVFDQVAIWRRYGIELALSGDGAHVAVRFPSGASDETREGVRSFVRQHKAALLILVANEVWPASQVSNGTDQDYDYAANYDAGRGMVDLLTHDVRFMASLVGFLVDRAARRYVHEARYDLAVAQRHWNAALREVPPPEHPEAARRFKFGPDASQVETVVSWSLASEGDVDYDEDVDNPAGLARFEVDARPVIDQLQPSRRITGAKLEAWIAACEEPIYRLVAQVLDTTITCCRATSCSTRRTLPGARG